jgi:hypothetical protein
MPYAPAHSFLRLAFEVLDSHNRCYCRVKDRFCRSLVNVLRLSSLRQTAQLQAEAARQRSCVQHVATRGMSAYLPICMAVAGPWRRSRRTGADRDHPVCETRLSSLHTTEIFSSASHDAPTPCRDDLPVRFALWHVSSAASLLKRSLTGIVAREKSRQHSQRRPRLRRLRVCCGQNRRIAEAENTPAAVQKFRSSYAETRAAMSSMVASTTRVCAARRTAVRVQAVAKPSSSGKPVKNDAAQMQVRCSGGLDHVRIARSDPWPTEQPRLRCPPGSSETEDLRSLSFVTLLPGARASSLSVTLRPQRPRGIPEYLTDALVPCTRAQPRERTEFLWAKISALVEHTTSWSMSPGHQMLPSD